MPATVGHEPFLAIAAAFESLGKVVALLDEDFRIVCASPALRGLFSTPEPEGRLLSDFINAPEALKSLFEGRRCEGEVKMRDGRTLLTCGGILADRSFFPDARYVIAFDLGEGVAMSPSEEAERIIRALESNRWRRSAAARSLGMSRATLWRRMREFGI